MELELPQYPPGYVSPNAIAVKSRCRRLHTDMFGIQIGTYATRQRVYAEVLHCTDGGPRISYIPLDQIYVLGSAETVAAVSHIPRYIRLVRADPVPVD